MISKKFFIRKNCGPIIIMKTGITKITILVARVLEQGVDRFHLLLTLKLSVIDRKYVT